jgi:uncharacterized protein YdhG (YjbR/CyaY superfamily)
MLENEAKTNAKQLNKALKKSPSVVAKKIKSALSKEEEQVKEYMGKLKGRQKAELEAVRKLIKESNSKLNERIKWNAPSYYFKDDIVTFGPYKPGKLLLVFHHPAVVKVKSTLLQGDYKNRRLVYFKDATDAGQNKKELSRIINEIIKEIK